MDSLRHNVQMIAGGLDCSSSVSSTDIICTQSEFRVLLLDRKVELMTQRKARLASNASADSPCALSPRTDMTACHARDTCTVL